MNLKCLLPLLSCLFLTSHSLAQPATRELADFFSSLSPNELRDLSRGRDTEEKIRMSSEMGKRLTEKEVGKQWTVHCVSGTTSKINNTYFKLSNDSTRSQIKVNGERVLVTIQATVSTGLKDQLKECRPGRKIFIVGTVQYIRISMDAKLGLMATIDMNADDLGADK